MIQIETNRNVSLKELSQKSFNKLFFVTPRKDITATKVMDGVLISTHILYIYLYISRAVIVPRHLDKSLIDSGETTNEK